MKKTIKRRIVNETASMNFSANGDSPQDIISILGKITNLSRPSPVTQDMMPKTGPAMPLVKSLDVVRNAEMDEAPDEIGDLIKSTGADKPSSSNIPTPPSRPPELGSSDAKPSAPSQDTSKPYKPQGKDDTYNGAPEESLGEIMKLAGMKHDVVADEDMADVGKWIGDKAGSVANMASSAADTVVNTAGAAKDAVMNAPSAISNAVSGAYDSAKQGVNNLVTGVQQGYNSAGQSTPAAASGSIGGSAALDGTRPGANPATTIPGSTSAGGNPAANVTPGPSTAGGPPKTSVPSSSLGSNTGNGGPVGVDTRGSSTPAAPAAGAGRGNTSGGPTDQAGRDAAAANRGSGAAPAAKPTIGPGGKVSADQLNQFRQTNPGATLGQYMNAAQGKTAVKGGANDPSAPGFKGAPTINAAPGGAKPAAAAGAKPAPAAGAKPAAAPAAPAPAGGAVSNRYGFAAPGSSDDNAANFFRADKAMQADKAATAAAPKAAAPAAAPRATPQAAAPKAAAPAASKPIPQPPQKPAELRPSAPLNKEVGPLNPTAESQYRAMKSEYDQLLAEYTELKRIKNLARGIQQLDERGPGGSAGRGSSGAGVGRSGAGVGRSGAGVGRTPFSQTQMPRRIPNNLPDYRRPYYQQNNGSNFMRQLLPGLFAGLGSGIAGGQNNTQTNGGQNNTQTNGGKNNTQTNSSLGDYAISKDSDGNTVLTHKNGTTHTLGPDGKVITKEPPLNDTDKKYLDSHNADVDKAAADAKNMNLTGLPSNNLPDTKSALADKDKEFLKQFNPKVEPNATPAPAATPAAPTVNNVKPVPNPTTLPTGALNPAPIAATPAPAATPALAGATTTSGSGTPNPGASATPAPAATPRPITATNPTGSAADNDGWGQGEGVEEEWDNEPNPKYRDVDYMNMMLAGGLDGPKKTYPKVAKGDNPMQQVSERVLRDLASDYMSIKNG